MVEEIRALGGIASANYDDVSDWAGAENMINQTVEEFGDINVLICNAGILRDRTMLNMSEAEWDLIFQVHCKGSFAPAHFAGNYWKNKSKETGQPQDGRVIFTTSQVGIFGNYGQSNYAAAKAANAMFAMTLAGELDRYGVTVNAVCPSGITRMTEDLRPDFGSEELALEKEKMARQHVTNEYVSGSPNNVAPLIAWLVSPDGADVTGRVFNTSQKLMLSRFVALSLSLIWKASPKPFCRRLRQRISDRRILHRHPLEDEGGRELDA